MKNIIMLSITSLCLSTVGATGQIISTSNTLSQKYNTKIPDGQPVYGVFAGRTPCKEVAKELNIEISEACAKRKMGLTLFQDPITHQPTTYETRGMGNRTGKGRWNILKGTPTDPNAIIFQLHLDANTSLLMLKGDENVLFILNKNRNFLIGNANYSYTFNRVRN